MPERAIPKRALRRIDRLASTYLQNLELVDRFRKQILVAVTESSELAALVHSFRSRLKDQDHLRNKLIRKWLECRRDGTEFAITPDNLLVTVNDLAGIRILHLHTTQMKAIDGALQAILTEQRYAVLDRFARTWDDESRELFASMGIRTEASATLYTSVHYIVGSNSQTHLTAEIQVRTLMEEVWGEVDHELNYPETSASLACREQLKVLARATSTATRLVDSIYRTLDDHNSQQPRKR